jgi:hypothetical protein
MTDTPISRAAVLEILRTPKSYDTFPDMIARVEALEGVGVRVKPLVWEDYPDESFCEPYQIEVRGAFWRAYFLLDYESADPILTPAGALGHPTREAAKAAAQAHHDPRIMAALEPMEPKDE